MSETEVQNSILEYLCSKDIFAWRNNSHAVFDERSGSFRSKSNPHDINGVADILSILPDGKFLAIEVKKNKNCKASPSQKLFMENISKNNGITFLAWSVKMVEKELKKHKYI